MRSGARQGITIWGKQTEVPGRNGHTKGATQGRKEMGDYGAGNIVETESHGLVRMPGSETNSAGPPANASQKWHRTGRGGHHVEE